MAATSTSTNGSPRTAAQQAEQVVRDFLAALEAGDVDACVALVADDLEYVNVGMPAVRGRRALERLLRALTPVMTVKIHCHNVAVRDGVVLTERTDALVVGRWHWQFWVAGRFEVRDGRIAVWRDAFDYADLTVGAVRGLLGVALPPLARRWPGAG